MTILAASKQTISIGNFTAGQPIRASSWASLAQHQHYVFSRTGVRVQGIVWDYDAGRDPFLTTTSGVTWQTADQNNNRDLDTFWPQIICPRRMDNSGDSVAIEFAIVGNNVEVRMTARATDTDTDLGNVSAQCTGASNSLSTGTLYLSWANAHVGGSTSNDLRTISLRFEARSDDGSGTGELFGLTAYSEILTAAQIPTAEP